MSKAFTLIELLVVIAIVILLSALFLPNYRDGSNSLALQRSASKLAQDLRRAQEMAMSAKEVSGVVPYGFGIHLSVVWNHYIVLFADLNNSRKRDSGDLDLERIRFEPNVAIYNLSPTEEFSILFTPPDPTVWIDGFSSGVTAQITLGIREDPINKQTISVNNVGLISVRSGP